VATCDDGRAGGRGSAGVSLFALSSGRALAELHGHAGTVKGLAFAEGGAALITCGFDKTLKLWVAGGGEAAAL